jgi:hypothetical protein
MNIFGEWNVSFFSLFAETKSIVLNIKTILQYESNRKSLDMKLEGFQQIIY